MILLIGFVAGIAVAKPYGHGGGHGYGHGHAVSAAVLSHHNVKYYDVPRYLIFCPFILINSAIFLFIKTLMRVCVNFCKILVFNF